MKMYTIRLFLPFYLINIANLQILQEHFGQYLRNQISLKMGIVQDNIGNNINNINFHHWTSSEKRYGQILPPGV